MSSRVNRHYGAIFAKPEKGFSALLEHNYRYQHALISRSMAFVCANSIGRILNNPRIFSLENKDKRENIRKRFFPTCPKCGWESLSTDKRGPANHLRYCK